jgi:hypothetical protein
MWNWLQDRWGSGGVLDTSIGWYNQEKIGNVGRIRSTFAYKDRSQNNFSLMIRGHLWHNELTPVFRGLINTRNWGYVAGTLNWGPGPHMRYETVYIYFFADNPWDAPEAYAENMDFVYLRIGYEF